MVEKVKISENGKETTAGALWNEFTWLAGVMNVRLKQYNRDENLDDLQMPAIPKIVSSDSDLYAAYLTRNNFTDHERLILILSLVPEFVPSMLVDLYNKGSKNPDLGLIEGEIKGELFPTRRTALFLLGGMDFSAQFEMSGHLGPDTRLINDRIIELGISGPRSARWNQILRISKEAFSRITTGKEIKPTFNQDFPAQEIKTSQTWDDLILNPASLRQVMDIKIWLEHGQTLLEDWGMHKKFKPGYRALFYGPPGTGKTMTASLLGKLTGRDVYRLDLSMVVSKYIGETEKNLNKVFDLAEHKNWILFFDEADSLFGKRGKVSDSRDRYANQEVSFLLQRVEGFDGLVILASNFKSNMDDAFLRRFQSVVHFPFPQQSQRLQLWKQSIPKQAQLQKEINLSEVSRKYELAGGAIINIVQYASLMALHRGGNTIFKEDLYEGIKREYNKEGKAL